jgi:hypothetical protein
MPNNTLLILDLNKNYDLVEKKTKFICLNKGIIKLENCQQIFLKKFNYEKKNIYKKILSKLLKIILINKNNEVPLVELEINNLRNDRYNFIDRIINLSLIKKIILSKGFKKIKIISDNKNTINLYDKLKIKIEKIDLSKKENKVKFFKFKLIKFYIKTLAIVLFLKFKKNDYVNIKNKEFYFSIYPNKFNYRKKNIDNENIFNFLLTDETHLNHSIFQIFKIIKKQNKKKTINVENFISIKHLICLIFKTLFFKKNNNLEICDFDIDNLNFNNEIKQLYIKTYLNRLKLSIYDNAITLVFKKFNVKNFHMYLFEYCFGFYLINKIKNFSNKVNIIGYQHGIFSENLYWFDILRQVRSNNNYFPTKILASNPYSARDYKKKLRKFLISISNKNDLKKNILSQEIKISKNSNNIIILPGTHDISDLYYFYINLYRHSKKKIFFKLHPKNQFIFKNLKNIYQIKNHKNNYFSDVVISQTSSLVYDFLKINKKFSVVNIDYRSNLLNKKILKKTKVIS